ncbi:MAG: hypothetical protein WCL00_10050, partial [Bacteroidota bacterium]
MIYLKGTLASNFSGTLSNTATVTSETQDNNLANNSSTVSGSTVKYADLSVTKGDGTTTYTPGTSTTYTIDVLNNGPSDVIEATVTDNMPAGITSWSWTGSNGSSGTGNINEKVNLSTGVSIEYSVVMNIPSSFTGSLVNTANVAVPVGVTDNNLSNNSSSDTDTKNSVADLVITKTDNATQYIPGTTTTYTIVVSNNGPSDVTGATVIDYLPAGVTWAWSSTKPSSGSSDINETVNLAVGASITYTVDVTIPSSLT